MNYNVFNLEICQLEGGLPSLIYFACACAFAVANFFTIESPAERVRSKGAPVVKRLRFVPGKRRDPRFCGS